jgi:hypothetical protein
MSAALDILVDNKKQVSVYCDWHDDYVVEMGRSIEFFLIE